ncbi:MAG: Asp-tRNA(Asn)/Glu-tRNA(Gln) amidotransferase subunit GatC [Acidiferrobacter sp.]
MNKEDIEKIAHLARLGVSEQERDAYAQDLSRILGLVEQMNAVDTVGVEPMTHPDEAALRWRPDVVTLEADRERLLALAPQTRHGLYLVPKVID